MAAFGPQDLFGGAIVAELPIGWIDASDIRQIPDHQEVFLSSQTLTSLIIEINEYVPATATHAPASGDEPQSCTVPSGAEDYTQFSTPRDPSDDEDQRAALYHLNDLVSSDEESSSTKLETSTPSAVPVTLGNTELAKQARAWQIAARVSSPAPAPAPVLSPLPPPQTMEEALTGTRSQAQAQTTTTTTTTLHLLLIRLPAHQTDLCIQLNVPWKELLPIPTPTPNVPTTTINEHVSNDPEASRGGQEHGNQGVRQVEEEEALAAQILERVARTVEVREWGLFG